MENDLYTIQSWKQLLTQSDPLSTLLGALSVNQYSKCIGHIQFTLVPLDTEQLRVHRKAFERLQNATWRKHSLLSKAFETSARSKSPLTRIPSWLAHKFASYGQPVDQSLSLGSTRHHDRETDTQSASNKLSRSCFEASIRIRVSAPKDCTDIAHNLIYQIFAPLAQSNAPRLGRFKLLPINKSNSKRKSAFLLSCHELASIYHPPTHRTETLATSRYVPLEPPKDLPTNNSDSKSMTIGNTCSTRNRTASDCLKTMQACMGSWLVPVDQEKPLFFQRQF